jgi:hypothetical protein
MILQRPSLLLTCALFSACATRPELTENASTVIDPVAAEQIKLPNLPSKPASGLADYKHQGKSYKAEWMRCTNEGDLPLVAVLHDESDSFDSKTFCQSWQAQVLLSNGFNVIGLNRPSFGNSTGQSDLSGPQSLTAMTAALQNSGSQAKLTGIWGYGTGSITASFLAKSQRNLLWLMLGNGFYDLEAVERTSKNDKILAAIAATKSSEGDIALERRSIAWDNNGLPKTVTLYHAKANDVAPRAQAEALVDQLRTMQTKVFFDDIEGVGHVIPWQAHYKIADHALKNLTKKK